MNKENNPPTATAGSRQRTQKPSAAPTKDLHEPQPRVVTQRLSHELEVHQIELEMQNQELRRVQEELERSLYKYAELFDFAPVGYFALDVCGLIREVNLAGAQLLGIKRQYAANAPFVSFIADTAGKKLFANHLASVLKDGGVQRCELRLSGPDDKVIHGQLQSVAVGATENSGAHIFCSIVDGTLGKKLKAQLQEAHDNLELTVQQRTEELTKTNEQLVREIDERMKVEESLKSAYAEIKGLKDLLQAENIYLRQEADVEYNFGEIVGQSKTITKVFSQVKQVAPMDATVLLLGETGTGKGVVARAIHSNSARKDRPMITVNCTALPANLIESELFGREKGAFTGASAQQIGRFELAHRGTIFLDEIGEMPMELQCKLLRVIQDGEFERLGSPRTVKVDVRIIAATNRNLEEEIRNHRFREDLFYRLNVFPITIPPLRQRKGDIPLLVEHFIARFNKKSGKKIRSLSTESLDTLEGYHWPGNVRELENVIERAVITSKGPFMELAERFDLSCKTVVPAEPETKALAELEHDHILQVLLKTGWRIEGKNGAAGRLGLNPSTLRARMRKYGIKRQ